MRAPFEPPPFPYHDGLVVPLSVDRKGLVGPTRKQVRGPNWRRTSHGFYVPSSVELSPEQRIVEASPFLGPRTALTGWACLRWLGATWLDGTTAGGSDSLPVSIVGWGEHVSQEGFRFTQERQTNTLMLQYDGLPLVDPWSAVCFEMRHANSVRQAVLAVDMACQADLVTLEEMSAYLALHRAWTGIPQARTALALADENVWSPQETRLRLVWMLDCEFPRPLCNVPIFDRGGSHLLTPDIFDPVAGVCGEYDGAHHLERGQRRKDRDREARAREHGLEFFTVMAGDLGTLACEQRMKQARARARFQPPEERGWTVDPPSWWTPTLTVEQRRRLSATDRNLWLGETA